MDRARAFYRDAVDEPLLGFSFSEGHPSSIRSSAIAEKVGDLGEAPAEIFAYFFVDALVVERGAHASKPRVAHRRVHRDVRVTHAKPRVAVLRTVFARPAEPFDEEERKGLAHARCDLGLRLIRAMDRDERGLVRVHVVVEPRSERSRALDAETVEGSVVGAEAFRVQGQWRFDFGKSDFNVLQ